MTTLETLGIFLLCVSGLFAMRWYMFVGYHVTSFYHDCDFSHWNIITAMRSTRKMTKKVTHWMPLPEPPKENMSIIIKGMEMPKGRPVCIVIDAAGQARRYDLNNDRYADDKLFEAIPVPPHGDLIDRDAFLALCREYAITPSDNEFCKRLEYALTKALTIISAEEET